MAQYNASTGEWWVVVTTPGVVRKWNTPALDPKDPCTRQRTLDRTVDTDPAEVPNTTLTPILGGPDQQAECEDNCCFFNKDLVLVRVAGFSPNCPELNGVWLFKYDSEGNFLDGVPYTFVDNPDPFDGDNDLSADPCPWGLSIADTDPGLGTDCKFILTDLDRGGTHNFERVATGDDAPNTCCNHYSPISYQMDYVGTAPEGSLCWNTGDPRPVATYECYEYCNLLPTANSIGIFSSGFNSEDPWTMECNCYNGQHNYKLTSVTTYEAFYEDDDTYTPWQVRFDRATRNFRAEIATDVRLWMQTSVEFDVGQQQDSDCCNKVSPAFIEMHQFSSRLEDAALSGCMPDPVGSAPMDVRLYCDGTSIGRCDHCENYNTDFYIMLFSEAPVPNTCDGCEDFNSVLLSTSYGSLCNGPIWDDRAEGQPPPCNTTVVISFNVDVGAGTWQPTVTIQDIDPPNTLRAQYSRGPEPLPLVDCLSFVISLSLVASDGGDICTNGAGIDWPDSLDLIPNPNCPSDPEHATA
jgi:hypothetical protein